MLKKHLTSLLTIITTIASASAADQKPDMKFITETAKIVWNSANEHFNPKADLTDSIFDGNSVVCIASERVYNTKRGEAPPFGVYKGVNREYLGETTIDTYYHKMVKLNDAKAVEDFSEISFGAKKTDKLKIGIVMFESQQAAGARIYKPDGSMIEVDMSAALPKTGGKKDKAYEFKLAIPGLEPGDVLDIFKYTRLYWLGDQEIHNSFDVFEDYPTAYYKFTGIFDKILTNEVSTFNGLTSDIFTKSYGSERDTISLEIFNLEGFETPKFSNKRRQIPYFNIKTADNYSRVFGHAKSSRRPGLYFDLTTPVLMAEVAEHLAGRTIDAADTGKAWGLVKNYRKANPEASWENIADAAWLATQYTALESKEMYGQWELVSLFKDVIDKAKLPVPAKLAVTSSRYDVPVRFISSYRDATPLVIIGDRTYLHDQNLVYRPGELPGIYQGELAITFEGTREKIFESLNLKLDTLPDSRTRNNTEIINILASINPDNEDQLNFKYTSTTTGARKSPGSAFLNSSDIIELTEDYLGIKENKRSKRKFDFMAIDDNRRKALEAMAQIDLDLEENLTVDSASITSPGFLPDNDTFEYYITGSIDGLITNAGNDILINIGNLVGATNYTKIDRTKPRELDIYTSNPYNLRYRLTIDVPDGYTVDPASLEQLQVNKATRCGSYFVQATYNKDNKTLTIETNHRNNRRIYPASMWNEFLDLRDAAIDFSNASVVLTAE
ncbi:MAG: DUF3857 domain-containing protein [Muribaculaceae bacterium]|nr:DUF3857 domain-containing protein [Muribaculaceae bacterium]